MWGLIPGPRDHDLSWRQMLNWLNHPGIPKNQRFLKFGISDPTENLMKTTKLLRKRHIRCILSKLLGTSWCPSYQVNPWSKPIPPPFFWIFYLFMRDIERERGREMGRGRSRLHSGSPMWNLILKLQDHALSQRQMLNWWATQASQNLSLFFMMKKPKFRETWLKLNS